MSDSSSIRAIALSSISGKKIDEVMLYKQSEQLTTFDLQFGLKIQYSTTMSNNILIESVM